MATIKNFEDLSVWKEARILSKDIYQLTKKSSYSKELDLKNQIKRSAGSITDNIAEGFERGGNKEFIQFLYIAKGSYGELRSQLYRSVDFDVITEKESAGHIEKAKNISSMLQGFISYLKNSGFKGDKYVLKEPKAIYKNLK